MSNDKKSMFVLPDGRNVMFTFMLVSSLFLLWGFINGMIDVMDKHFQDELGLTKAQSAWVQFAHYLGYFLMSIPAGILATRLGYKGGIIAGLLLVAVGGFLFIPATHVNAMVHAGRVSPNMAFVAFLTGVCVIASGLTFLETIANPYTTVLGDLRYAATRINLAQSCNGVGWILGPIVGSLFFYSKDASGRSTGSETLYIPYVAVAIGVIVLAAIFYFANVPDIRMEDDYHLDDNAPGHSRSIWSQPHFTLAVAAQFFYVAAQAGIFSFFINYMVAEPPPVPAAWQSALESFGNNVGFLREWVKGWFEAGADGSLRFSDKGAFEPRVARPDLLPDRAVHRRLLPEAIRRAQDCWPLWADERDPHLAGLLQTRLAFRALRLPQLLLHVDHVSDDLRSRHLRARVQGEEGLLVYRDGHHGRRHPAQADGRRRRPLRHVAGLHRSDVLLRLRRLVRL